MKDEPGLFRLQIIADDDFYPFWPLLEPECDVKLQCIIVSLEVHVLSLQVINQKPR